MKLTLYRPLLLHSTTMAMAKMKSSFFYNQVIYCSTMPKET
jgi:hypothetical protein